MGKEYNTDFLNFLLNSGIDMHIYFDRVHAFPNGKGKWSVINAVGYGQMMKENIASEELVSFILELKDKDFFTLYR